MNYKPNPSIDLEFQPFLTVGQKKTFSMFFFWKNSCEKLSFCSTNKSKIPKYLE